MKNFLLTVYALVIFVFASFIIINQKSFADGENWSDLNSVTSDSNWSDVNSIRE